MKLTIFNEQNGIYAGVNTPQFAQLEYLITTANTNKIQIPSLGLFGEASTGKTTAAKLLAKAANYHFLYFNASSLTVANFYKTISAPAIELMTSENNVKIIDRSYSNVHIYESTKPFVILIDEAHELCKDLQTLFLSILETKDALNPNEEVNTISTKNVTFIFATTDSSKLLYPLTTRLFSITFDQYSKEDVASIIKMKYSRISNDGLQIIAQCSKLVPRVALVYAEQLYNMHKDEEITKEQVESFVKNALNMESNGIDSIDKRILLYLAQNKKKVNPVDEISLIVYKESLEKLLKKGIANFTTSQHKEYNRLIFNISVLETKLNNAEYIAKSRQDISLACRILDLGNLETRLSYLEKLNMVEKTSKGIMLHEQYR